MNFVLSTAAPSSERLRVTAVVGWFVLAASVVVFLASSLVMVGDASEAWAVDACYGAKATAEEACETGGGVWVDTQFQLSDVADKLALVVFSVVAGIVALFALLVSFRFGIHVLGDAVMKVISALRGLVRSS